MNHHRLTRAVAVLLAAGAVSAPAALAAPDVPPPAAFVAGQAVQDKRSPDAIDAATAAPVAQDKRSPDAIDAADGRSAATSPEVVVVKLTEVARAAGGFAWADAAIGAGAVLGLVLLGLGGVLVVVHRRHAAVPQAPPIPRSRVARPAGERRVERALERTTR